MTLLINKKYKAKSMVSAYLPWKWVGLNIMVNAWMFLLFHVFAMIGMAAERTIEAHEPSSMTVPHNEARNAHWDYLGVEGPEHWGMLSQAYMTCETGGRQSPINIEMANPGDHQESLVFYYNASKIHVLNNGHTIQVSHKSGCRVDLNRHAYKLRQFHFHEPSEHHIEGKAFPMEMHLVHQDEVGHVLVIAVLMEIGAEEPVLAEIWNWLPEQFGKERSVPLNASIGDILPSDTHHFSYTGSLTTPPCTEGVQWIVLKEPIKISKVDVEQFVNLIGHNARPIQSRHGQSVEEY